MYRYASDLRSVQEVPKLAARTDANQVRPSSGAQREARPAPFGEDTAPIAKPARPSAGRRVPRSASSRGQGQGQGDNLETTSGPTNNGPRSPLSRGVEEYLKSRALVQLPTSVLANAADYITDSFQQIALKPEYQKKFVMNPGEQQSMLLWRAQSLREGSLVDDSTKETIGRYLDEIIAADPLLFSALNCAFCFYPEREPDEFPSGFVKRFLKSRANGPGALSREVLIKPDKFEGLRYVPLDMRLKWRQELPDKIEGRLLKCEYLPDDGTMGTRKLRLYWYRMTPPNWDQISRTLSRNHPLNADVRPPREACPDGL